MSMTMTEVLAPSVTRSKLPRCEFFSSVITHSWIFQSKNHPDNEEDEDRILIHENCDNVTHASIWGVWAWDVDFRGYYDASDMKICAHHKPKDMARLESLVVRAFKAKGLEIIYASWGS